RCGRGSTGGQAGSSPIHVAATVSITADLVRTVSRLRIGSQASTVSCVVRRIDAERQASLTVRRATLHGDSRIRVGTWRGGGYSYLSLRTSSSIGRATDS